MTAREFNFDGLIGPTHNYAGLSFGNIASAAHQHQPSSPRAAALQGLQKMKYVADLGIGQCVLPPLRRPRFEFLRELGFSGDDKQLIDKAFACDPVLLATCYSASNMWTANAATVSPSQDSRDDRLHVSTANLSSTLHRSIEHPSTYRNLRAIFANESRFAVHRALPSMPALADEGAANHTRLCPSHGQPGIETFVFGVDSNGVGSKGPKQFPARQTKLASQAIARKHQLDSARTIFLQQNPVSIDAGVFHNDVISVGNENVLLCHELAFVDQANQLKLLTAMFDQEFDATLFVIELNNEEISIADAVASYLFNSQLVTRPDGGMTLICPIECQENPAALRCTERIAAEENPVDQVAFLDLGQSMNNGGGPACLRLRVVLESKQQQAIHQGVVFTEPLLHKLTDWVEANYREQLAPDDLRDPNLVDESLQAIEQLAAILGLPADLLLDQ